MSDEQMSDEQMSEFPALIWRLERGQGEGHIKRGLEERDRWRDIWREGQIKRRQRERIDGERTKGKGQMKRRQRKKTPKWMGLMMSG